MKFSEKYEDEELESSQTIGGLLFASDEKPCVVCGDNTKFIEFSYERRMCSEECVDVMDELLIEHQMT